MRLIYMRRNFCCFCCSFQTEVIVLNVLSCMVIGYVLYGMIAQTFFTKNNLVTMYEDEIKPKSTDPLEAHEVVESLITFYWIVMVVALLGLFAISLNCLVFIPPDKHTKSERRIFLVPWLVWCVVWLIVIIALQIWIDNNFEVDFLKAAESTILQCLLMTWSLISGFSYYHFLKQFTYVAKEIVQKPTEFQRTFEKLKDDDTPPSSRRQTPVYNARNNLLTPRKSDISQQNIQYSNRPHHNEELFIPSPRHMNDMNILPNGKIPTQVNMTSPYPPLRQNSIPNMVHVKPFIVDKSGRFPQKTNINPASLPGNSKGTPNGYLPLNRSYTWAGIYAAQEVPNNTLSKSLPDTTTTRKQYKKRRTSSRGNMEFDVI